MFTDKFHNQSKPKAMPILFPTLEGCSQKSREWDHSYSYTLTYSPPMLLHPSPKLRTNILQDAMTLESHDENSRTGESNKIEEPEIVYIKIQTSDVDIENRLEELEQPGFGETIETDIKSEDSKINIKMEGNELFNYEMQEQKSHVKIEIDDVKLLDEELIIKDDHTVAPQQVQMLGNKTCSYQSQRKETLQEQLLAYDHSQDEIFSCKECNFQSRYKRNLKSHKLVHKDTSQIKMFKCNQCKYQTKNRSSFSRHLLVHKDLSHIKMFKCYECNFQSKVKGSLQRHLLLHKDPSQTEMFKCNECNYQSRHKCTLKRHVLIVHRDSSQTEMFNCNKCNYQCRHKCTLKRHLLIVHKDPSPTEIFKCNECNFQSKYKGNLKCHIMLVHGDITHMKMFKCNECDFQSKYRSGLQKHVNSHRN